MKNIILCSDGTGNAGGRGYETNVWRLFKALDLAATHSDKHALTQVAFHDDGVGTQELKAVKALAGAFGIGLKRNVRELYRFLIRNYQPGQKNQIYIFGFSRGAYTARMLAELICLCGIINPHGKDDKTLDELIYQAFEIMRVTFLEGIERNTLVKKSVLASRGIVQNRGNGVEQAEKFIANHSYPIDNNGAENGPEYLIRFVGVWDTVPAYGFPIQELADFWNYFIYPYKFDNRNLHPRIRKGVHALAIDDARKTFRPMLWEHREAEREDRIEQVWFPGVHAGVGGGYPKDGLAFISLDWMMEKASSDIDGIKGLKFIDHLRAEAAQRANPYDKMYDSRSGLGVFYRFEPRDIEKFSLENNVINSRSDCTRSIKIHPSVIQRIKARTEDYAPGNVPARCKLSDTEDSQTNYFFECFKNNYDKQNMLPGTMPLVRFRQYLHVIKLLIIVAIVIISSNSWLEARFAAYKPVADSVKQMCGAPNYDQFNLYFKKLSGLIPMGETLYNSLLSPVVVCTNFFSGFLLLIGLVVVFGLMSKRRMAHRYSQFWTRVMGERTGESVDRQADKQAWNDQFLR